MFLQTVYCFDKVFLRIQQANYCHMALVCCQRDEFIIFQCILLQFRKLMKSICPSNANSVHIRFQWQQIVDKKRKQYVHQFVPYAKSRLASWIVTYTCTIRVNISENERRWNFELKVPLPILAQTYRVIND